MSGRRTNPSWPGLYRIVEGDDFFTLRLGDLVEPGSPNWLRELIIDYHGLQRYPVTVIQRPYHWQVEVEGDLSGYMGDTEFDLLYWLRLYHAITYFFTYPYKGVDPALYADERNEDDLNHRVPYCPSTWQSEYLLDKCRASLYKRIRSQYQRLLNRVSDDVRAVHKSLFVNCHGYRVPQVVKSPDFYSHPYVVHDVTTYRAAAIACTLAKSLDDLGCWQGLFSPTGRPYRSLSRTLMTLPGGMSPTLVGQLRNVELERPIYDRVELIVAIAGRDSHNRHVFMHAKRGEIEEAFTRVSERIKGTLRRTHSICRFVRYLMDYPDLHRGRILGLAQKAIRWHRQDVQEQERQRALSRYGPDKPTALPPILLPTDPHLRFLERVTDISEEGRRMSHCVGSRSYVEKAVNGSSYLFHVDYQDQRATVEVDRWGQVVQAQGPQDHDNDAAAYGRSVLTQWGSQLRGARPVAIAQQAVP
jgi:hypothetical protein